MLMKSIEFCGHTLRTIKDFPVLVRHEIGHQLDKVQHGLTPSDWKPIASVGKGAREIRIHERGQFRVIYLANYGNTVYVLHAFRKKTRKTRQSDIKLARVALNKLLHRNKS
jgi:phage-related protein